MAKRLYLKVKISELLHPLTIAENNWVKLAVMVGLS